MVSLTTVDAQTTDEMSLLSNPASRAALRGQPSGSVRVLRPTVEIRLIIGTGNFVYLSMYWNVWTCVLPRGPRHMGLPSSHDGV